MPGGQKPARNLKSRGRKPGSRNKKTLEKERRGAFTEYVRVLNQRLLTPTNINKLRRMVDKHAELASSGSHQSARLLMDLYKDANGDDAQEFISRTLSAPSSFGSSRAVLHWILESLPDHVDDQEALKAFMALGRSLFDMELEQERIAMMHRNAVPIEKLQRVLGAVNDTVTEVLMGSDGGARQLGKFRSLLQERLLHVAPDMITVEADGRSDERTESA